VGGLLFYIAVLPVAYVQAKAVRRPRETDGMKVLRHVAEQFLVRRDAEGRAVALDADSGDLALSEVGEEKVPVKLGGKRVLVVSERAARRARAKVVHHPKRVGPA